MIPGIPLSIQHMVMNLEGACEMLFWVNSSKGKTYLQGTEAGVLKGN